MAKVFLDAIIKRADFEEMGNNVSQTDLFSELKTTDLQSKLIYPFLRKPDFQRETNEWDENKICDFLDCFINGDLIPSIILWRSSSGFYFIIDGAHRLSALLAWLNDDYGDGKISLDFFDGNISEEQKKIAESARKKINRKIGSYESILNSIETNNELLIQKAKNVGAYSLKVQWVKGDVKKAENSFFKINQQGVPLNKTEEKLLENRRKGNCIAARAIKTGGVGHKYWAEFNAENQNEIQRISEEINKSLFTPPLIGPVKSPDLPIAGKISSAQTVPLILDFVNIVNSIPIDFKEFVLDDETGDETLKYLKKVRKVVWRINSVHQSSLGLHPLVYFYSVDGRHKPASFYAATEFVMELESQKKLNDFIKVRNTFEAFLLKYSYFPQQFNDKYKYASKSYKNIALMYLKLVNILQIEQSIDTAAIKILQDKDFNFLKIDQQHNIQEPFSNFTNESKSAVFIKEALTNPIRCKICQGLIHQNSITIDHIVRDREGGKGNLENGQLAHPFCNSTYKN